MATLLLIGTRKGGFIATSNDRRETWTLGSPILKGSEVNHVSHVGDNRLIAAGKSAWWGPAIKISDDGGASWRDPASGIRFPDGPGRSVGRISVVQREP